MSAEEAASPRSDVVGGLAWVAFGLAVVGESLRMDRFTSMGASLYTMPGLVPGIFGAVLVLLGGVMLLRGWRRATAQAARAPDVGAEPRLPRRRMLAMLGLTLGYAAVLVGRVPFTLATFVFLALFMAVFSPVEHHPHSAHRSGGADFGGHDSGHRVGVPARLSRSFALSGRR